MFLFIIADLFSVGKNEGDLGLYLKTTPGGVSTVPVLNAKSRSPLKLPNNRQYVQYLTDTLYIVTISNWCVDAEVSEV